MLDGARGKKAFGAPMFEHMSFGSKCTALKKVLVTLFEFFGVPRSQGSKGSANPRAPNHYESLNHFGGAEKS